MAYEDRFPLSSNTLANQRLPLYGPEDGRGKGYPVSGLGRDEDGA